MSHIENIEIKNFKSISCAKIEGCRRINVFVGPPNTGKSNILEAIGLLTFIRQKRVDILKELVRFEKLTHLFNFSNIQNPAIIEFNKKYSVHIKYEDEQGLFFQLIHNGDADLQYNPRLFGFKIGDGRLSSGSTNDVDNFASGLSELQSLNVKPYKFSDAKVYNKNISALELNIPFGKNMFEVIINNTELRKEFSDLLKPYDLDLIIDISESDIKVSPKIKDGIINTIPISLIADTLIRLIFFKTAIISSKDSVLLLEEPEANCYEPYISETTNAIKNDKKNNQFFIVTHSQYVVDELLRDEQSRNDTNIYLVGIDEGETKVKLLSPQVSKDVYQTGLNIFFNYQNLWDEN